MPQRTPILTHLRMKGSITHLEALKMYGNSRLSSTILNLRQQGYQISTEMVPREGKNSYARYHLVSEPDARV